MKSIELLRQRIVLSENKFAELVLWRLTQPLAESEHTFKYRLAYVVNGECVLRYDNEAGKGDHRHLGGIECDYIFAGLEQLQLDFWADVQRWRLE